jgi:two-component system CheB/CheR fusion protein
MKGTRPGKPKPRHTSATAADGRESDDKAVAFPIVGVGASAGGLEAFSALLGAVPVDTGMAFVLIQHLDPEHDSALVSLLGRVSSLPVTEAADGEAVQPDHVYVIPKGTSLTIVAGRLKIAPRARTRTPHRPIDAFFESLAADRRERAIGVVLSGTGSDGTLGLEAVKSEGGITFAQDESARHDSMPRSAVASGCVDLVLEPAIIAAEISRIARHPYVAEQRWDSPDAPTEDAEGAPVEVDESADSATRTGEENRAAAVAHEDDGTPLPSGGRSQGQLASRQPAPVPSANAGEDDGHKKILLLLHNHSGVDFSLYKNATIRRRIHRRLVVNGKATLAEYAGFLRGNAKELDALYSDVLISVTSFFRDPEAFQILQREVLPKLIDKRGEEPVRCWILGCSTGQEAYSVAMAFVETMDNAPRMRQLQVFATDLNEALLDKARHGLYAKSLAEDVTPQRLERFFIEEEGGYRVRKALRERVVFARQNLISDPPFSRMDLISCRNLLIYLEPSIQKKALPTFHYALKPGGFLMLGASETIGTFTELFEPVDKKHKIYAKKPAPSPTFHLPMRRAQGQADGPYTRPALPIGQTPAAEPPGFRGELDAQREADRVTVRDFAPPAVLVNAELQIQQFRGPTGAYLEPPAGKATLDVLKMARPGLMLPLRSAINEARKENAAAVRENVRIERDGTGQIVNLRVIPLQTSGERNFLIVFEDAGGSRRAPARAPNKRPRKSVGKAQEASRIAELDRELAETREYLQAVQEQFDAINEELQAANEESQSSNEELQSINEELETSKEELESANEELRTVNDEMSARNVELNGLNNDLVNFQTSARMAIVLLARDLTIRRFSQQAEKQLDLLAVDIGRPLDRIRHGLTDKDRQPFGLERVAAEVIADVREQQCEVLDKNGRWLSLRVRPYMTLDNKIDGAVLVLQDIDALKRTEQALAAARDYADNVIETIREPLVVLRADLRVERVNRAFLRTFRVQPEATVGRLFHELGSGQWNIPELRELLEQVLPRGTTIEDFEVTHSFETVGRRSFLVNAREVVDPARERQLILLAIEDITERKAAADTFRQNHMELRERAEELARFNDAAVGRELRMIELKAEVNELRRRLNEVEKYRTDFEATGREES